MRPKLGVLDFNPIQYRTPLYQRLAKRGNLELNVLFLTDHGYNAGLDPGFGVPFAWNIDLLSGYCHRFLTNIGRPVGIITQIRVLTRWVKSQDAVIVYGYAKPWMLFAMAVCRSQGIPYLMRGESHPRGQSA